MKNNWPKKIYWSYFVFIIVLILLSTLENKYFKINNTSVLLLIILILFPYFPLIRKIKFGEFEAEISSDEVKKVEEQAENIVEGINDAPSDLGEQLYNLSQNDLNLAFAKVRMEIEQRLRTLSEIYLEKSKPYNLRWIIGELTKREIIDNNLAAVLKDIVSIANRAVHGDAIGEENAQKLISISINAINALSEVVRERAGTPISKTIISGADVEKYRDAKYEIKSIVPYVNKPEVRTYLLNQAELYAYLEGYQEYAEFIINIKRTDEK